jgi:hypothetical protein
VYKYLSRHLDAYSCPAASLSLFQHHHLRGAKHIKAATVCSKFIHILSYTVLYSVSLKNSALVNKSAKFWKRSNLENQWW